MLKKLLLLATMMKMKGIKKGTGITFPNLLSKETLLTKCI